MDVDDRGRSSCGGLGRVPCLLFAAGLCAAAWWALRPPAPAGTDAPPEAFSAARAFRHVEAIARRPRPAGSPEDGKAREYILERLRELGHEPRVEDHPRLGGGMETGTLHNITLLVPGEGKTGRAVMVAAHHDSVRTGPGAADDGAAVASIIETLRALERRPPLRNDLLVLITDGEEAGLLGAEAFAASRDRLPAVGVFLNFEARGTGGPLILFETTPGSAAMLREFARAGAPAIASSLGGEVYRRLPNDTDLTVFRRAGLRGMNFAFIGGASRYHTALDAPENLDRGTLQAQGETMLRLVERLGSADLEALARSEDEAVYFTPFPPVTVAYPEGWVLPSAVLGGLLLAAAVLAGVLSGRLRLPGLALGLLPAALGLLAPPVAAHLLAGVLPLSFPLLASTVPDDRQTALYLLGLACLALAFHVGLAAASRRRVRTAEVHAWHLAACLGFLGVTAAEAPGASYLFAWPLLLGLPALLLAESPGGSAMRTILGRAAVAAGSLAAVIVIGPAAWLAALALSIPMAWAPAALFALLLGLLAPVVAGIAGPRPWRAALGWAGAAAAFIAIGAMF